MPFLARFFHIMFFLISSWINHAQDIPSSQLIISQRISKGSLEQNIHFFQILPINVPYLQLPLLSIATKTYIARDCKNGARVLILYSSILGTDCGWVNRKKVRAVTAGVKGWPIKSSWFYSKFLKRWVKIVAGMKNTKSWFQQMAFTQRPIMSKKKTWDQIPFSQTI